MRIMSNILNSTVASVALAAVLGSSVFTANTSNAAETWVLGSAQPEITGMAQTLKNVFVPRLENFSNGQIEVRSLGTGESVRTLEGHTSWVDSLAIVGGKLFSGSDDATIKVWK